MSSVRKARSRHRWRPVFLGSHLCERLVAHGGRRGCASTTTSPAARTMFAGLVGVPHFEAMRHDITHPLFVEGRRDLQPRPAPASPIQLSVRSGADHQDQRDRRESTCWVSPKRLKAQDLFRLPRRRSMADPDLAPAARSLSRQCQSDRSRAPVTTRGKRCAEEPCSSTTTVSTICEFAVVRIFNTYGPADAPQ